MTNGAPPGASCSTPRRSTPAAVTSSPGSARSCRGSASTRTTGSTPRTVRRPCADLFRGRSQLIVHHFMFDPDWTEGCPSCSSVADGYNGVRVHLENHDVAMTAISRAPLEKLLAYRERMGWSFPWASSSRQRLQLRLRRVLHRGPAHGGRAGERRGTQLQADPGRSRAVAVRSARASAPSSSTMASCTTRTPRTPAGPMRCGACTSGSTGRRSAATRATSGSAATTNTRNRPDDEANDARTHRTRDEFRGPPSLHLPSTTTRPKETTSWI